MMHGAWTLHGAWTSVTAMLAQIVAVAALVGPLRRGIAEEKYRVHALLPKDKVHQLLIPRMKKGDSRWEGREFLLSNGSYVRQIAAPPARMGTVSEAAMETGETRFIFHQDARLGDPVSDFYVFDFEIEECDRPSDAEAEEINRLRQLTQ
jgi:hypothetical protein